MVLSLAGFLLLASIIISTLATVTCPSCHGSGDGRYGCCPKFYPCTACDGGRVPLAKRAWIQVRLWKYEFDHRNEQEVEVFRY